MGVSRAIPNTGRSLSAGNVLRSLKVLQLEKSRYQSLANVVSKRPYALQIKLQGRTGVCAQQVEQDKTKVDHRGVHALTLKCDV